MADFTISYNITAIHEGGYSFDRNDSGGQTWRGIARNKHPEWGGWAIVDRLQKQKDFPNNLLSEPSLQTKVLAFYKSEFWDAMNLDYLEGQLVANELYDTAVNMGIGRAALWFQRVLNVMNKQGSLFPDLKLDAQVGAMTIKAFNSLNKDDKEYVWKLLNCLQGEKYISICEANPTQEKFIRSWTSRVL